MSTQTTKVTKTMTTEMGKPTNVHHLKPGAPKPAKPNPYVVKVLEQLLQEAKGGQLRGLMFVGAYQTGVTGAGWTCESNQDLLSMLGEIQVVNHRAASALVKDEPDDEPEPRLV